MGRRNRAWGLMAGITMGFAVWGTARTEPVQAKVPQKMEVGTAAARTGSAQTKSVRTDAAQTGPAQAEAAQTPAQDELKLHALSAVLMDGDSGRILYGKDTGTVRPMASTTKIMTCILALENGTPEDICTVSASAASQPKVHLGASKGTEFYLKDLLYSLMLESHNDSAVMIAEHIGGSVEGFAAMMNQKARDIGCKDTCFVTPNGLDAVITTQDGTEYTHGTTAADLAAIMRYCIGESPKREEFLEITRTANYSFTDRTGKHSYYCANHNAFLNMMDGALTGKTGFTGGAGYSYVGALKRDDRTFVIALLGSGWPPHKTYKWADAKALFGYGVENYRYRDVYKEPELPELPAENAVADRTIPLTTGMKEEEKHLLLLVKDEEQVEQQIEVPQMLKAPVRKGELVGHVVYTLNGEPVRICPVYADASVEQWSLIYCIRQFYSAFLSLNE